MTSKQTMKENEISNILVKLGERTITLQQYADEMGIPVTQAFNLTDRKRSMWGVTTIDDKG